MYSKSFSTMTNSSTYKRRNGGKIKICLHQTNSLHMVNLPFQERQSQTSENTGERSSWEVSQTVLQHGQSWRRSWYKCCIRVCLQDVWPKQGTECRWCPLQKTHTNVQQGKVCYLSVAAKSNLTPFQLGIKWVAFTGFNLPPWSWHERVIIDWMISLQMHIL